MIQKCESILEDIQTYSTEWKPHSDPTVNDIFQHMNTITTNKVQYIRDTEVPSLHKEVKNLKTSAYTTSTGQRLKRFTPLTQKNADKITNAYRKMKNLRTKLSAEDWFKEMMDVIRTDIPTVHKRISKTQSDINTTYRTDLWKPFLAKVKFGVCSKNRSPMSFD